MTKRVEILRIADDGRGVGYVDKKIIFVANALPEEIVDVKITLEKKKYLEGQVTNYIKKSSKRINPQCPYFNKCGGCALLNLSYEDTIDYKINKIRNLFIKNKLECPNINVIKNNHPYNYRNKIELKIKNGQYGYYQKNTHDFIEIKSCLIASNAINNFLKDVNYLNIKNGSITIRSNYNNELILDITTTDKNNIDIDFIKSNHKLVGIIFNNKKIYGDEYFIEKIGNYLFRVSYDAFFQINSNINKELFNLLANNIDKGKNVLDLYSGVGTLGIVASSKANKVYSLEIVTNAIKDGLVNAKMNKRDNIHFMLGDVAKNIDKIKDNIDTIILDPPRSGLDKKTLNYLKEKKFAKTIYISCNPLTLIRDLKELNNNYKLNRVTIADMFSYTYHCESIVVLERK